MAASAKEGQNLESKRQRLLDSKMSFIGVQYGVTWDRNTQVLRPRNIFTDFKGCHAMQEQN